jgi:hypothetical protein
MALLNPINMQRVSTIITAVLRTLDAERLSIYEAQTIGQSLLVTILLDTAHAGQGVGIAQARFAMKEVSELLAHLSEADTIEEMEKRVIEYQAKAVRWALMPEASQQ